MTIKKRLFLSNILMILVPAVTTVLIGFLCSAVMWLAFTNGTGWRIQDPEEFNIVCAAIAESVEEGLGKKPGKSFDSSFVEALLDGNNMAMRLYSDGEAVYSYGTEDPADDVILKAVQGLDSGSAVTQNGRAAYVHREEIGGTEYTIYLTGAYGAVHSYADLKAALAFAAVLVASTVVLSIFLTNRFLTGFVLRRIEEPLDLLSEGVREIGQGNLECRIVYDGKDEFEPVCSAFNEMAWRLKISIERSRREEESRKELLAGISHDLRSPLTCIQAYVEGLLDGVAGTPEVQKQYLKTIRRKVCDIDRMVSQLFLFSQLELDEYPMELRPVRLDEMVTALVSETKTEYDQRGLEISTSTVPVTVLADGEQLRRVLSNIMDNSAKYKTADRGHLWITVEDTGAFGCITLSDDGPGVSQEALPKLFDAFYRTDPARQNTDGGCGLGLAIAAKTVQKMGGTIEAEHRAGGGLSIVITLPGKEENGAEDTDH